MAEQANYLYDADLALKTAGLIAASAAVATVVDIGSAAFFKGEVIIDVTALEIASNDEIYDIVLQGTNVAAFATDTDIVDLCSITLAAAEVQRTDSNADTAIGRFIMPYTNERNGSLYRYLRLYTIVAGTIATGINYKAYLSVSKQRGGG